MAGTTTKGLRYPTAGDNPAVHTDILNLATDVDTELDNYILASSPSFSATVTLSAGADILGAVTEFADEASAVAYVETYLSDTTWTDPLGVERTFVVADAVADLFAKLV